MAVTHVKNWKEGDTYVCEAYDDWAESQRYSYTPFLHVSGKWRIKVASQQIDSEGNLDDPDEEVAEYDMLGDQNPFSPDTPVAEFDTKGAAIGKIHRQTYNGKNGVVTPNADARRYERESEAEIRRLVDKD